MNNFQIDGAQDPKAVAKAVEVAVAQAVKRLPTPTSGSTWYESTSGLVALG